MLNLQIFTLIYKKKLPASICFNNFALSMKEIFEKDSAELNANECERELLFTAGLIETPVQH
ncbi:MAG: hypothetical protein DRP47_05415 [Candidatus Zixiibacteriota bacterium]|nr:MAG: hypothetical protein DRP47_05415 [candidate division Zixibacteria bacterium]